MMQNGSRGDLARLALHDTLAAHTEQSERAPATLSTSTSASPACPSEATSAAAVKILTREEWQELRQLQAPPQSAAGDTPNASAGDSADESSGRPLPQAAAPPSQAYSAAAVGRACMHVAGSPFQSPCVQPCLNSGGGKGGGSDDGLVRTRENSLTNSKTEGGGSRTRTPDGSYSGTLHLNNPTQSSLSTVQTLSNIPQLHMDNDGAISSVHMIGSEPYRMHHIGFPIMEPSPVAGHSPTIISKRAADIFRWNSKDSLTVTTPVATTTSAPASIGADSDWPMGRARTRWPEAVAEGEEEPDTASDYASVAAESDNEHAAADSDSDDQGFESTLATFAPAGTDVEAVPDVSERLSTAPHAPPPSVDAEAVTKPERPVEGVTASADARSAADPGSMAEPASAPSSQSLGSLSSGGTSRRPPSQGASYHSAMLVAQPHPDSLTPPSGSFSPRTATKAQVQPPASTASAAPHSVAADSALQVEVVNTTPRSPAWTRFLPTNRRRLRTRALSSHSSRSARRACCSCFAQRGKDAHSASALLGDALRTAVLALLMPVFSWPVLLLLALALVATLVQLAVAVFVSPVAHPTHYITLVFEVASVGFALVWAALSEPSEDEAWCGTLACALPLAVLWSLAATSALARLATCVTREATTWWRTRSNSPALSPSAASDAASKPPLKPPPTEAPADATVTVAAAPPVAARALAAPPPVVPSARVHSGHSDVHHGHASSNLSAGYASEVTLAVPSGALPSRPAQQLAPPASTSADTADAPEATGTEGLSPMTAYSGSRGPPTPLTDRPMTNTFQPVGIGGSAAKPPVPSDSAALLSARRTNTTSSSAVWPSPTCEQSPGE